MELQVADVATVLDVLLYLPLVGERGGNLQGPDRSGIIDTQLLSMILYSSILRSDLGPALPIQDAASPSGAY